MRGIVLGAMVLLACLLTGCQTARFYSPAARGQWEIMKRQRPLDTVAADPLVPARIKERLVRVEALCRFASTNLDLPADGHYRKYADLGRPHVVWNVFASPEFSLEAKRWWYPLLGRLKYQGYFREAMAEDYARRLRKRGYDVCVGPVDAYSTLGWFHDPVLNTWIDSPDTELAELVFHELTHQRLFISGDTDFNEAFATATARIGVRRWLRAAGRDAELAGYEASLERRLSLTRVVMTARQRLERFYASLPTEIGHAGPVPRRFEADVAGWRREKEEILGELRARLSDLSDLTLNNARLNEIDTYDRLVPDFERLFEQADQDLPRYFKAVTQISRLPGHRRLPALQGAH